MDSNVVSSRKGALEVFRRALSLWQDWIAANCSHWPQLGLQGHVSFEDISKLQLFEIEGEPGALFDHNVHERRFDLCHALLDAYAEFWLRQGLDDEKRRLMAELFLLHEFSHLPQGIASSTYFIDGASSVNFFSRLDYKSDAFALRLCYTRHGKEVSGMDKSMLLKLLGCQYLGGHVFGSVERTNASSSGLAIEGFRMRRQLVWAFQYARSKSFPPEQPFAVFDLHSEVDVQLYPAGPDGLGNDLCDLKEVTASELVPPLVLKVLRVDVEEVLQHEILTPREASSFRSLLLEGRLESASESFRSLFAYRPDLVGRWTDRPAPPLKSDASSESFRVSSAPSSLNGFKDARDTPARHATTGKRHTFTTPASLLEDVSNDYSDIERQFAGRGGILIDVGEESLLALPPDKREEKRVARDALLKQFLRHDSVPKLAVVVNVAKRPRAFPDVLRSLARQSFLKARPRSVEVLLVQDGPAGILDDEVRPELLGALSEFVEQTRFQGFRLRANRGRSTARNVGIFYASSDTQVIMFLDDAMILHEDFVAEQMLRHGLIGTPIALLGFKANREFKDFEAYVRERDQKFLSRPPFEEDWKWSKNLKADEVTFDGGVEGFEYRGKVYKKHATIAYMEISNNLKDLRGVELIGHRGLPMFFHTGLTSVTYDSVCAVGGFEQLFDVDVWGFEDSYLGLLLAVKGVKIIPCPSSVAYKVELKDEEVMEGKGEQLAYHRKTFWDCAEHREMSSYDKNRLVGKMEDLMVQQLIERVPLSLIGRREEPGRDARSSSTTEFGLKQDSVTASSILTTPATALVQKLDTHSRLTGRDAAVVDDPGDYSADARNLGVGLYVDREIEKKIISVIESSNQAILIYGEAGTGKTSLLWKLYEKIKGEHSDRLRPWFLKATTTLEFSPEEIGESMQVVRRMGCKPVLLIDTIDLIVGDPARRTHFLMICEVASEHGGSVIATCRPREQGQYLAGLVAMRLELGDYTESEFKIAIKRHVDHYCPRSDVTSQLEYQSRLNDAVIRGKPVREICLRPLTLRMLFSIYGPGGDVPTEINGAHLYNKFWEWRVKSDRRPGEPFSEDGSTDVSDVAEVLATEMLAEGAIEIRRSHALSLLTKMIPLANRNFAIDLDTLVRRGILRSHESRLEFFHQTFFEHAAARGVLELIGSLGLNTLANRCHTNPDDLFRAPVLEQALILSDHYDSECRASASAIVDRLLESDHVGHLVTAAYVYAQLSAVTTNMRQAAEKAMLDHPDEVATRFIASIPSIPPERAPEVFRELDFIWENLVAPKLKSAGKWAGGTALLDQLPRLAVRGEDHAERVLGFLNRHGVVRIVAEKKDTADGLLRVIKELAPYSPKSCWESLVLLYPGLRAKIANTVATQARFMQSKQIATDFETAVEGDGPTEGLDLDLNRAWGRLWARQWDRPAGAELPRILSQVTTQNNQVRFVRQLYGLAHFLRSRQPDQLVDGLQNVWTCFLAKDNEPYRTKWIMFWKELLQLSDSEGDDRTSDVCEDFLLRNVTAFLLDDDTENRLTAVQLLGQLLIPEFSENVTRRLVTKPLFDNPERWLNPDDLGLLLPIAYVLGQAEAKSLVLGLTSAPKKITDTMREKLLGEFAARAELGSAAALDVLFRFAEKQTEARKKILLVLEGSHFQPSVDNPLSNVVLERENLLNAICTEWLSSPNIGDRRNAARLLYQMVRFGVDITETPEKFYNQYKAELDHRTRIGLAIFMGEWASSGGSVQNAIDALIECAASEKEELNSKVFTLTALVQCCVKNGELPARAKEILGIALSVRPTEKRLIEAARMIKELAPHNRSVATEVLEEFATSDIVRSKGKAVTNTFRRELYQSFKTWVLHSSGVDRKRLIDKIDKFEPNLACLLLTAICDENFDEVSEYLSAIELIESTDKMIKGRIHSIRKTHRERTQGDSWPELRAVLRDNRETGSVFPH